MSDEMREAFERDEIMNAAFDKTYPDKYTSWNEDIQRGFVDGWKAALASKPQVSENVCLSSDTALEQALRDFTEKHCAPGSAADPDSFIYGYRACGAYEGEHTKKLVEALELVACRMRDLMPLPETTCEEVDKAIREYEGGK